MKEEIYNPWKNKKRITTALINEIRAKIIVHPDAEREGKPSTETQFFENHPEIMLHQEWSGYKNLRRKYAGRKLIDLCNYLKIEL